MRNIKVSSAYTRISYVFNNVLQNELSSLHEYNRSQDEEVFQTLSWDYSKKREKKRLAVTDMWHKVASQLEF